jgi:hypothetical protein
LQHNEKKDSTRDVHADSGIAGILGDDNGVLEDKSAAEYMDATRMEVAKHRAEKNENPTKNNGSLKIYQRHPHPLQTQQRHQLQMKRDTRPRTNRCTY